MNLYSLEFFLSTEAKTGSDLLLLRRNVGIYRLCLAEPGVDQLL